MGKLSPKKTTEQNKEYAHLEQPQETQGEGSHKKVKEDTEDAWKITDEWHEEEGEVLKLTKRVRRHKKAGKIWERGGSPSRSSPSSEKK